MEHIFKKHTGKLLVFVSVLLFICLYFYAQSAAEANNEGVVLKDHIKGNPDATIVLEKWGDFECPACKAAHPVMSQIMEEFGDDVRFEYKHLPLTQIHPNAFAASVAAEAAGQQDAFFAYHDILYERQSEWSRGASAALFVRYAEELGLDVALFRQHQNAPLLKNKVRDEAAEALRKGYQSTPTVTLGGEKIRYGGYEQLKELLESVISSENPATPAADVHFSI